LTPWDYLLVDDPPAAWAQAVESLRGVLAEDGEYGPKVVAERFRVPADYDAFRQIEGRVWESAGPPTWVLLNSQGVSPYHRDDFDWRPEHGLWLVIGDCYDGYPGDTDWMLLGCDARHPLFGAVVLGYDYGCPYKDGVPSPKCRVAAPSFLEYLRRGDGIRPPDDWPVPELQPDPIQARSDTGPVGGARLEQIRANAAWVARRLSQQSGLVPFAPPESVAYLDGYLERHRLVIKPWEDRINRFVCLLGAYLGECIVATYGGEWCVAEESLTILIRTDTRLHLLKPFHKVYKRIVNGHEDDLAFYFTEFIPRVLAGGEARQAERGAAPDRPRD
jgi:hypothetical protein